MASASLKGTRKTYSFEERKILISLINKHEIVQDRKSDPISICKRKSAWSRIAEEYNSMVGSRGARSAVQLRRCWENMKACKRNREERKLRDNMKAICQLTKDARSQHWEGRNCDQNVLEASVSTRSTGLPPNVVFEPKDSEPFTLQSVCITGYQNPNCLKKDVNSCEDSNFGGALEQMIADKEKCDTIASSPDAIKDYYEKKRLVMKRNADSPTIDQSADNGLEKITRRESHANPGSSALYTLISPRIVQEHNHKRKSAREEELHVLALSEARMKVDIAAMLKEEARVKLEEAHYRKEEARLRMLLFTYKLDRIKDE
ncbi:myb/SANT-like DNA-binding domain-containing protein 3 [Solenopsis invicta]|uniref:myb/SANT-like DNA-binding domain-containing protein 3 n=1 Tax=Solenopsis invicta TaxID=13686 RepID=UPI0001FEB29F|nr:myb/SANT-like DNA-binding domain-containing protein 3 [Solenopsis invicta]XP_039303737.1 myb/SANT-like DNA-binding domain-containing protein 3 [Solenopsis invicta]